jgi:hypothetical protein
MAQRNISRSEVAWTLEYGKKYPHNKEEHKVYCVSENIGVIYSTTENRVITVWGRKSK